MTASAFKPTLALIGLISCAFILVSCNMPETATQEVPACDPNSPPADLPQPVDGTIMNWFDDSQLVYIEAGEFQMGVPSAGGNLGADNDNNLHTVFLDDYWIYRYPVTNAMYQLCVNAGVCEPPRGGQDPVDYSDPAVQNHPVVGVDWQQAQTYCNWMDGGLPTEAEWEKAARGPEGNPYPWGSQAPDCNLLNMQDCVRQTTDVTKYAKGVSIFGVYDLLGNTFDWVADWYQADYYLQSPAQNPPGPAQGTERAVRGSSYQSSAEQTSAAKRFFMQPEKSREDLGFRCVIKTPADHCEPFGFAPACNSVVRLPAAPPPAGGQPPAGEPGAGPGPGQEGCALSEPAIKAVDYCAARDEQIGAVNIELHGEPGELPEGCVNGDPIVCTGPAGSTLTIVVCTSCEVPVQEIPVGEPECAPGFQLQVDGQGRDICVWGGIPGEPGGECPAGFFNQGDMCVRRNQPDPRCPKGFGYDAQASCCQLDLAEPSPGGAGVPGIVQEPGCPIGWERGDRANERGIQEEVCFQVMPGGDIEVDCRPFEVTLGVCRIPDRPDGGDPGGDCDPGACSASEFWCQASCSCKIQGNPCP